MLKFRNEWWTILASPLEGSNEIRRLVAGHRQVFGLAGFRSFLLTAASRFTHRESVLKYGVRSCSPLRDSSGFAPDSLIDSGKEPSTRCRVMQMRQCFGVKENAVYKPLRRYDAHNKEDNK